MNNQTIVCCVVALLLGMLLANMLKNVCGCKVVEGQTMNEAICRCGTETNPQFVQNGVQGSIDCNNIPPVVIQAVDCAEGEGNR